jgi:hypothetical protein
MPEYGYAEENARYRVYRVAWLRVDDLEDLQVPRGFGAKKPQLSVKDDVPARIYWFLSAARGRFCLGIIE